MPYCDVRVTLHKAFAGKRLLLSSETQKPMSVRAVQPLDKSVDEYGKIPIQHIQVKMRSACFRLKANLFIAPIFQ